MNIAVLSGKGGTGKTTVAVNLAAIMGWRYLDCDIEEPNGWAFLRPELRFSEQIRVANPQVDADLCNHCGACVNACQFNALGLTSHGLLVLPRLCHGCGLCKFVCPRLAISEQSRPIGRVDYGQGVNGDCWQGVLNVGEPSGVQIIDRMLRQLEGDVKTLLDCSPGTSCNVVAAAKAADFALLVTESTPFGAHDLELSLQLLTALELPGAIVINRCDGEDSLIRALAREYSVPIVATLPFSRQAAATCAVGELLLQDAGYRQLFAELGSRIEELIACD